MRTPIGRPYPVKRYRDTSIGFRVGQRSNVTDGGGGGGEHGGYGDGGRDVNSKRGGYSGTGGFRHLALRKSEAAQPVVLVSMTRRPSSNSAQQKPFKWKTADDGAGERLAFGAFPDRHPSSQQLTNVDDPPADRQPGTTADGRDNPAYSLDKHDV